MQATRLLDRRRGRDRGPWPPWARAVLSMFLVFHLTAILAGVLAAPPSSLLEQNLFSIFRTYSGILNQGYSYRFYSRLVVTTNDGAPLPWGTPIVTAELEFTESSGKTTIRTVRLPDQRTPWPRLRFQRQIDLAYHLAADPRWAASYARHLWKAFGCSKVTLYSQIHAIPDLEETRKAAALGRPDPTLFEPEGVYGPRTKLGEFACSDF